MSFVEVDDEYLCTIKVIVMKVMAGVFISFCLILTNCQDLTSFRPMKQVLYLINHNLIPSPRSQQAAIREKGENGTVILTSAKMDQNGGKVIVEKPGSPLEGLVVEFPPGAIDRQFEVSISMIFESVPVRSGKNCGFTVVLAVPGIKSFKEMVSIMMPYEPRPGNRLVIPYEIDSDNRLHIMDIGKLDANNRTLVIFTFKPVRFTLVYP